MSDSLWPHRLQHSRPPCPSRSPGVCPSSCPLRWWCHPAISSSWMPSPHSACNLSQHQGLFQWVSCSHQMMKILELQVQHQSFQREFRIDFPSDWLVWSPCWLRDFQESSPAPQLEGITALVLHLLHGPALTTVHGHWEDHSLIIGTFVSRVLFLLFTSGLSLP